MLRLAYGQENNEESNTEIHEENMENTCDNEEMSQNICTQPSYCDNVNAQDCSSSTTTSSSLTKEKLTYNQVVTKFQQVAATIQHDQKEMCRLNNAMDDLLYRYCRKDEVKITICTVSKSIDSGVVGTTRMNVIATQCSRKISFRESQEKRGVYYEKAQF